MSRRLSHPALSSHDANLTSCLYRDNFGIGDIVEDFANVNQRGMDPNMVSWEQYLKEEEDEESSEDDFRGDSLNDADWDGQSGGIFEQGRSGANGRLYKTVQPTENNYPE